jgi:hypothetical protein
MFKQKSAIKIKGYLISGLNGQMPFRAETLEILLISYQ